MAPLIFAAKPSSLTIAQIALIEQVKREWRATTVSDTPLIPSEMEELVGDLYLDAGLPRPAVVLTVTSPFSALIANIVLKENLFRVTGSACAPLDRTKFHPTTNAFVSYFGRPGPAGEANNLFREALSRNIDGVALAGVNYQVSLTDYPTYCHLYSGMVREINHQTGKSLEILPSPASYQRFLRGSRPVAVRALGEDAFRSRALGQAFLEVLDQLGLEDTEAGGLDEMPLARQAGAWWLFEQAAIVVARPTQLKVGPSSAWGEAPHSLNGPALRWVDGFAVFAVFGHALPPAAVNSPADLKAAILASHSFFGQRDRRAMLLELGLQP